MNKFFIAIFTTILFVLIILVTGCKKDVLREIDDPADNIVSPCKDGIMNGDELDIDCGGSCDPCPPLVFPCNPVQGTVEIGSRPTFSFSGSTNCMDFSDYYRISADHSNGTLIMELKGGKPGTGKIYTAAAQLTGDKTANLVISEGTAIQYWPEEGSKFYVEVAGNQLQIVFCDVNFLSNFTAAGGLGSGNILVCN